MATPVDPDRMRSLKGTYTRIVVLETIVLLLLWWLGRLFS